MQYERLLDSKLCQPYWQDKGGVAQIPFESSSLRSRHPLPYPSKISDQVIASARTTAVDGDRKTYSRKSSYSLSSSLLAQPPLLCPPLVTELGLFEPPAAVVGWILLFFVRLFFVIVFCEMLDTDDARAGITCCEIKMRTSLQNLRTLHCDQHWLW